MATIHSHGSGWRVHFSKDGEKKKGPTLPTRESAASWMTEHLPALKVGSMLELIRLWVQDNPTAYREEASFRLLVAAAAESWGSPLRLTSADLIAWQKRAKVPRYGSYMSSLLHWAVKTHGLPIQSSALAWKPNHYKRKPPKPLLTDAQVKAIRACSKSYGKHASAVIDYLLTYGARPITACQLTLGGLDPASAELTIDDAKHSGGWRHAILDRHVTDWQALHKAEDKASDPLFWHYRERRAWRVTHGSAHEISNWYRNTIAKKLRLGALSGIYNLKYYAITGMLRRGIDPATVALFTGHLTLEQVLTYARSNADLQRAALSKIRARVPR